MSVGVKSTVPYDWPARRVFLSKRTLGDGAAHAADRRFAYICKIENSKYRGDHDRRFASKAEIDASIDDWGTSGTTEPGSL
jgi:hypothetical protein